MKKKITHPDGTIEEIEGTPEELAQLEQKVPQGDRKDESNTKGPRILLDSKSPQVASGALVQHPHCWGGKSRF
jgi:hypothetical protein